MMMMMMRQVGHFQHWAVDLEGDEEVLTVEQEQERALALQVLLKEEGERALSPSGGCWTPPLAIIACVG